MTFEVIVTTFLEGRGMSLDQVPITSGRDEQVSPEVTDKAWLTHFVLSLAGCEVDIVKSAINLAQSSRNRIKDGG